MIVNNKENMERRLEDEFKYLSEKHTHIAFNCIDWNRNIRQNKDYLYATEGYITIPENYNPAIINKFKGLITHNSKFYEQNRHLNIILSNGPLDSHNYYRLDNFVSYEDKIDGIVSLNRIYSTGKEGDILWMREPTILNIPYELKHTYGPNPWGGSFYQGKVVANHANHINNLTITNKYKFVLTLEPMYHELWSWDWVTERMWNAFKSKTIPIYYGCFNIEQKVPSHLFIDFRKYINDLPGLTRFLKSYTKTQYVDQTEMAYEWYEKQCNISKMEDLENLFDSLR